MAAALCVLFSLCAVQQSLAHKRTPHLITIRPRMRLTRHAQRNRSDAALLASACHRGGSGARCCCWRPCCWWAGEHAAGAEVPRCCPSVALLLAGQDAEACWVSQWRVRSLLCLAGHTRDHMRACSSCAGGGADAERGAAFINDVKRSLWVVQAQERYDRGALGGAAAPPR